MDLLVDLQGMQNGSRFRGIGRYVSAMARALVRNIGEHNIRFLVNGALPHARDVIESLADVRGPEAFTVLDLPSPVATSAPENGWRAAAAKRLYEEAIQRLAPDFLLIGSLFEGMADDTVVAIPPKPRRYRVATILYDLIPLIDPDQHLAHRGALDWYTQKVEDACRSDLLLGISESACSEGRQHLPISPEAIVHVGAAASDTFASSAHDQLRGSEPARELLALHGITKPYLMHTSAFDPRKNFEGLIAAFARLNAETRAQHQLVLVCRLNEQGRAKLVDTVKTHGLREKEVILTGYVDDPALRLLYANAKLFVFPSFHEGFGLPVLEAMWSGTPVIGSSLSSVPEVVGLEEAQFDPYDTNAMASLIEKCLVDHAFRHQLRSHGAQHVRRFSWDLVAIRALSAMEACLEKHRMDNAIWRHLPNAQTDELIREVGAIRCWPGAEDADLLSTAHAIYRINQLGSAVARREGTSASGH